MSEMKESKLINWIMAFVFALQAAFIVWMVFFTDSSNEAIAKAAQVEWAKNLKPIEIKKGSAEEAVLKLYSVRTEMAIEEHTTDLLEKDMAQMKLETVSKMSESGSASRRQVTEAQQELRRAELNVKYSKLAIEEAKHQYKIVEEAVLGGKFCPTVSTDFDIRQRRPR